MAAKKKLSRREALKQVLNDNGGGPMKMKDLLDAAMPLADPGTNKDPRKTLSFVLYCNPDVFTKTGRGEFKLTEPVPAAEQPVALDAALQSEVAKPKRERTRDKTPAKTPVKTA